MTINLHMLKFQIMLPGFEYFKMGLMTSTTGSHSEIVPRFKKIVSTLKEAKK